ncbi:MAG: cytochrome P450 [Bacteroidota bacterium]
MNKMIPGLAVHKGHWLWKSAFQIQKDPIGFFGENAKRYGDTFYASFPAANVLLSANPGFIKQVLQSNQKNYTKDRGYDQLALLLGKGLVTSRGEFWKKQRRIAQPTFHKKNLSLLFEAMREVARVYLEELHAKRGQVLDISEEMMRLTARIALKSLFSVDQGGDLKEIYESFSFAQEYVAHRAMNPLNIPLSHLNGRHRRFLKHKKVLDQLIHQFIEDRQKSGESRPDFLQMLLDARYEDNGEPMSPQQVLDELVTIFSAGHETSSNGLTWTLYLLAQHPKVLEKLKKEVQAVVGEGIPSFEQLGQLQYTRQVIEEGMRVYPPVWSVSRVAIEQDEWAGHPIKKGTVVILLIYHLHRDPALWESAETFDPDRFTSERVKSRPNHHYLPFGAGPRMCIGNHFALMEMQLVLPLLIRDFGYELLQDQKILLDPMVTLRPRYGIKMKIN